MQEIEHSLQNDLRKIEQKLFEQFRNNLKVEVPGLEPELKNAFKQGNYFPISQKHDLIEKDFESLSSYLTRMLTRSGFDSIEHFEEVAKANGAI